jgi:hypothetical protein
MTLYEVLKKIQDGEISPEEGERLINELDADGASGT